MRVFVSQRCHTDLTLTAVIFVACVGLRVIGEKTFN